MPNIFRNISNAKLTFLIRIGSGASIMNHRLLSISKGKKKHKNTPLMLPCSAGTRAVLRGNDLWCKRRWTANSNYKLPPAVKSNYGSEECAVMIA